MRLLILYLILTWVVQPSNILAQKSLKNDKKIRALHREVNIYYKEKNYEKALKIMNWIIELDDTNAMFYANRGLLYTRLENYDKALVDYNKAIELDNQFINTYLNLGEFYEKQNLHQETLEAYKRGEEIADGDEIVKIYINRGAYYGRQEKHEDALKEFKRAIPVNYDNLPLPFINLAKTYAKLDSTEKAVKYFQYVIDFYPSTIRFDVYHGLSLALVKLEKYQEAKTTLLSIFELIELNEEQQIKTYNSLANCYLYLDEKTKAREYLNKSQELNNEDSNSSFLLAKLSALERNDKDFYQYLSKAVENGFSIEYTLDEPFLKPYLEEERFKEILEIE